MRNVHQLRRLARGHQKATSQQMKQQAEIGKKIMEQLKDKNGDAIKRSE